MSSDLKKKVVSVGLILVAYTFAELLTNVILGRALPKEIFGQFKFCNTVMTALSSLLLFGQNTAIIKTLGKADFERFDWQGFVRRNMVFSGLAGTIAVFGVVWFYHLTYEAAAILAGLLLSIRIEYTSAVLRARGSYNTAMFLSKGQSFLWCVIAGVLVLWVKPLLLFALLSGYLIAGILNTWHSERWISGVPNGKDEIPEEVVKEGLWLFFDLNFLHSLEPV